MSDNAVEMEPVPVKVTNPEKSSAPEFGAWRSIVLNGNALDAGPGAQQLLPQEKRRKRAVVQINPGNASNAIGYVLVGNRNQVQNGVGGILANGNSVVIESQSEVWIASDGAHSLTVTVLDERYL